MRRATQGLDAVAGRKGIRPAQGFNGVDHQVQVQYAGDEVSHGGGGFFATEKRQIRKQGVGEGTANFGECVAVEKKEGCSSVARLEKLESFEQSQLARPVFFPVLPNRRVSFRVNASLRLASITESAIDLGDR